MTAEAFRRLDDLLADVDRRGVVHVGAHHGQEVTDYRRCRFDRIVLVEPNPTCWPHLDAIDGVTVRRVACGPVGEATLHVTGADQRASLLAPLDYRVVDTVTVPVRPLTDLQGGCNVAVIDVQGAELAVLDTADLSLLDAVVVEVTDDPRYAGAVEVDDVRAFFLAAGWEHLGDFRGGHTRGIADAVWRRP